VLNPQGDTARQRLIESAAELMAVQGYGRTCIEAILEQSGASKGNFYHHFASKEELGLAVLQHLGTEVQAYVQTAMGDKPDPLDRIDAMFDSLLATAAERGCRGGCPLGNLAAEMSDVSEVFREQLGRVFGSWRSMVAETLAEASRGHRRVPINSQGLAQHIVSSLEGAILMAKLSRDPEELGNTVTHLKTYIRQQFTK
jgi:TetR/AcrR family transcriptional repressor of nem operon